MSLSENIRFYASMYGLRGSRRTARLQALLDDLGLRPRKDQMAGTLSGGWKQRLALACATAHEPDMLFLDEPTAGVDVELRRDMWQLVRDLRDGGVTIILTTHYIEEAEEMADRIGIINKGRLVLVDDEATLIRKLGRKELRVHLKDKVEQVPPALAAWKLVLTDDGLTLVFTFTNEEERARIALLLREITACGIEFRDLETQQSSLEDIFVSVLRGAA
jgi:ABC-2 type transport system ATP-binding protein